MTTHGIADVAELEDRLSEPSPGAVAAMGRLDGDLLILGVGGKMGPTLARMARLASDAAGKKRRVIGVSRFSEGRLEGELQRHGVETIRCDLLDPAQLDRLPDAPNVLFMTGMKFGSTGQESLTWAMNAHLPALVCRRFRGSPSGNPPRVVAFSTGNVYGLTPVVQGGSVVGDPLRPVGEYAMSCVGRERIFEHFGRTAGMPMAVLRLNYAAELRYGVVADVARRVWAGEPIDLATGNFNAIWQGDANAMTLQAFDCVTVPPRVLNIAGPELLSVRRLAEQFGRIFGKPVTFLGSEAPDAYLSNAQESHRLFGYPRVPVALLVEWVADWVARGGTDLNKPTHFEVRDGNF